ncbi:hypothetical protein AABM38_12060 [Heyndrickxia sp. MSNUG]|uniref:hypothetical protein n=1 Tax=Heyndrickxia sp. MSNUG TaxID=3136677 RepID=UPI003C2B33F1
MKAFILFLLTLFLGLLIFLKLEMNEATRADNTIKNEYTTQDYMITEIVDSGYYGKDEDGKTIFFKREHLPAGQKLELDDTVVIYFEKDVRKDGLIKVEKK